VSWILLCLAVARTTGAAVPTDFSLLNDTPTVAWSLQPLNKGHIVEVPSFKADPGTIVYLGICHDHCSDVQVVKRIAASRTTTNNITEKYTLEQDGHLVFWTAKPPRAELNAGASKALSNDSNNPVAGAIHSGYSGLYSSAELLHMRKFDVEANGLKARYDGGFFVTLRRVSAAAPQ